MPRETSEPREGLMPCVVVIWRYRAFIALLIVMALVALGWGRWVSTRGAPILSPAASKWPVQAQTDTQGH